MELNTIYHGDCLEWLKRLEDNSADAIVTDPPYGLSFMGKKWDYDVPSVEIWQECLRVLKPGGHLLAFAGTRTQHRMAVRIEDAGFEIRDMIAWVYGSGFPKSLNIGKAVDKLQGNERETVREYETHDIRSNALLGKKGSMTVAETKGTSEWEGWGTALKPALEPITVARKPIEGTVAENCLKWGVGGINIDECRVETNEDQRRPSRGGENGLNGSQTFKIRERKIEEQIQHSGRLPANLIHDGSDEVVELFPDSRSTGGENKKYGDGKSFGSVKGEYHHFNDSGSAARFFYCAKASKSERNRGCEDLEGKSKVFNGQSAEPSKEMKGVEQKFTTQPQKNNHPTVKPIALMEYLVRLISKESHILLDPFAGSGSTLIACKNLNRSYIGCEMNEEYIKIAKARLKIV